MMMIDPYLSIVENIKNGTNFSFSRFGDGEMFCAQGKKGMNCDHHEYFPDLGKALRNVLDHPRGIMGLMDKAKPLLKRDIEWVSGRAFCDASIRGELSLFTDVLKDRNVVFVGPKHLRKLPFYNFYREVLVHNAWLMHEDLLSALKYVIKKDDVVIYCCGMMAPVLIHELYDIRFTQIDCGAVFDPYCGVDSRKYHKDLKI